MPNAPRLLLSALPKRFWIDTGSPEGGKNVRWIDFELGALEVDHPQIKNFLFRPALADRVRASPAKRNGKPIPFALAWDAVEEVDWKTGVIRARAPDAITPADPEALVKSVLVVRDILDAYVIDLQYRRLRRANDLVLENGRDLRLAAVDTGMRAIFRRLSLGLYRGVNAGDLQDWKYVEFLRGDPSAVRAGKGYHRRIEQLPPGEIANLAEGLPYLHATEEIMLLPHQLAADTIELMSPARQLQVFEELHESDALPILERIAPDIAADLIGRLAADRAGYYLERLPRACSERIISLLRYPETTVGGIMTNDMIALPGSLTVGEARERLREELRGPDFVYFLYVIENEQNRRLLGVVTLRRILVANDDQQLEDIMNPYLNTLAPLDSPKEAAYRLVKSQLAALPVVASDGRLLGVVTVDAAVSLLAPGAWSSQAPRIFS